MEAQNIIDLVCKAHAHEPRSVANIEQDLEIFTTGDAALDSALGGGIRTGMLWEVVGQRYGPLHYNSSPPVGTAILVPPERPSGAFSCP
jgi:hypothetical protein